NLASEMAEMRRQLAKMSSLVSRSAVWGGRRISIAPNPGLDELDQALTASEVDSDLACSILRGLETLGPSPAAELRQAWRNDIRSRRRASPDLSPWSLETGPGAGSGPARSIAALVGPPGVGKTTMLAKLAVRCGVAARRTTHIVSFDSHRIAPAEQLR